MSLLTAALLAAGLAAEEEPAPVEKPPPPAWALSLDAYGADPPGDDPFVSWILSADRGALHLEAHYGYEAPDTFALFVGRRFNWEGEVSGSVVPMFGGLVGEVDGVAPGLDLELQWRSLWLTSDSEYIVDFGDSSDSYFYAWNELGWTFLERFDVGLVAQRTHAYDQKRDVDRGFFVGWTGKVIGATLYVFNPDLDTTYAALTFSAGF
jgi:hypothetical protein